MSSTHSNRPRTFRVENIPSGTTPEDLKKFFYTEDQPHIEVRSIVPAVDTYDLYTATVLFHAPNLTVTTPRLINEDDGICVDDEFHGFTPLNHPQEPIAADIIAVTGLSAHAFGSWAHTPRNMWLRDYLPRDVSNARVLIYGYPSQLQSNVSRNMFSDHSANFIVRLLSMRESAKCQSRPLVFVGHSLGCLIIKKALCDINGTLGVYSSRLPVRSIIFLGAPHKGLHTTALETLAKSKPTEEMIRELKAESPTLKELNNQFRHVGQNMDIVTCYETKKSKTALEMKDGTWRREGPEEMMVSQDSAIQWYHREKLIASHTDHSHIAKLKRGENGPYADIKAAINQAMLSVGNLYSESDAHHNMTTMSQAYESHKPRVDAKKPSYVVEMGKRSDDEPRDDPANLGPHQSAPLRSRSRSPASRRSQPELEHHFDQRNDEKLDTTKRTHRLQGSSASYSYMDHNVSRCQSSLEENVPLPQSSSISLGGVTASCEIEHEVNSRDNQYNASESMTTGTKSASYDSHLKNAIKRGDIQGTKDLLATLYEVNCNDEFNRTPLHGAAYYRSEPLVKLLLELGAHPRAQTKMGQTTSHLIARPENTLTPLRESLIDLLLQHPPPLDEPALEGWTPLMGAASIGEHLLATKLISRGARTRLTDKEGNTALHYAAQNAEGLEMITLLIKEGALVEAKDNENWTPLHRAAYFCNLHAIKTLLAHGANPFAKAQTFPPGGVLPRGVIERSESTTKEQKQEVRKTFKEAEKEWKRSGKKYPKFHWSS